MPRDYDPIVAQIAGNIMSGFAGRPGHLMDQTDVARVVSVARAIVAETKATEPPRPTCTSCKGTGEKIQGNTPLCCAECGGRGHL